MHQFHKFILSWNSTCFGQFVCPSSEVYSLYTQHWSMPYRFVDSFRAGPGWWTDELSETCRVSWQIKFMKLVHLVGFITKKFFTMQHGHMNVLLRCMSHERVVTMHGHMNVLLRCMVTWTYYYDARSHELIDTMNGHMNVKFRWTFRFCTWLYMVIHDRLIIIG
jgi:hypothetical protein